MFNPKFQITSALSMALMQIEAIRQELTGLVIQPELLLSLQETAILISTHFSTQIEGNRLTLPEVKAVIKGATFPGRERDEREVRNHFLAFAHMEQLASRQSALQESEIRHLHGLVLLGKNKASKYRDQQNVIRDSGSGHIVYLPPEATDVAGLMQELVTWINDALNEAELPVPIIAALAHYQFATIHPYLDGNGRTARLLTTLILRRAGYGLQGIYSLDEHYAKNLRGYYEALSIGHHNYYEDRAEADLTQFVSYFCKGMADAFSKIRLAAMKVTAPENPSAANLLRELDPRQRRLLSLFKKQGSATTEDMAKHLKMSQRTLVALARDWVADGFLEIQNPSRKARSYRLADKFV
jgi:Fic family protein